MQPNRFRKKTKRRFAYSRFQLVLIVILLFGYAAFFWFAADSPIVRDTGPVIDRLAASWSVGIAELGEKPALAPNPPDTSIRFCSGVDEHDRRAITDGVALLRATEAGRALYDIVEREGVCIGTKTLDFNSAFATARWSSIEGWSQSEIIIGRQYVDWLYPDVIAAILAHEATHIQRAIDGTACYYADACTTLPNGVELEEEIVAHQAEAEWWLAAYGRDGKDRAFSTDASLNRLKAAYLQGPDRFRIFVREMRSDEREGKGL